MRIDKIIANSLIILMRNLFELDNQVTRQMCMSFISSPVELEHSTLCIARLHLHVELFPLCLCGPPVVLQQLSIILHFFHAPIVKLMQSALQLNLDVLWSRDLWLVLSSKGITKHTTELI